MSFFTGFSLLMNYLASLLHYKKSMGFNLCIIADDFTGAGDSAVQFRRSGFNAFLGLNGWDTGIDLDTCNVLVVSTESRFMDADDSYNAVCEAVKKCRKFDAEHFFKKIDSTMRGNVAAEVAALMDEAGYSCAIVAPSAPKNSRTVVSGHCLIGGNPIGASGRNNDLFTPVENSYVPALFESRFPGSVGHIDLSVIREGTDNYSTMFADLRGEGKRVIITDAETIDDLRIVASVKNDNSILFVGASGLAEAMTREKPNKIGNPAISRVVPGSMLFLVGSVTETSRQQVEFLRKHKRVSFISVNIPEMLKDGGKEMSRVLGIMATVPQDQAVLLETLHATGDIESIMGLAQSLGYGEKELGSMVSSFLGRLVKKIFAMRSLRALFVTGGDTAARTAEALGIKGIELISEVLPGIPLGRFVTEISDAPVFLISKAGGFGPEETMLAVYEYLTAEESSEIPDGVIL